VRAIRSLSFLTACAAAVAVLVAGAGAHVSHARADQQRSGALIPTRGELLPSSGSTVRSTNWSGYAVTSRRHLIAAVSGTFVVPAAKSSLIPRFAATWAGIGGYKTGDLIQAGTGEDSTGRPFGRRYFAWYELLPRSEQPIHQCIGDSSCAVQPGQRITVTIRRLGDARWSIFIADQGHWHWSKRVHYRSTRSSAEWILEAPTIATSQSMLAHVGTAHFGPSSKYTLRGTPRTIGAGNPVRILLKSETGTREATPSVLVSDGQAFNVCSYQTACSPP
jgi:hypothetical protein